MNIGKKIRLARLFSHPSGRLASIAMDHFIMYGFEQLPSGLRNLPRLIEQIVQAQPDSITMHRGPAAHAFAPHAGKVALIVQSTLGVADDCGHAQLATPLDALLMGADAFAVCGFVRGKTQMTYLKAISEAVQEGGKYEMPVIAHVYPRKYEDGKVSISYTPDDIGWAVHCAVECGVDVVKVPYCGEVEAYRQIVEECPLPVVAAGGPATRTFAEALAMLSQVVEAGARGAVVGRNCWCNPDVTAAVRAIKAVIHDGKSPAAALRAARLSKEG